jgi:hypothetical protein
MVHVFEFFRYVTNSAILSYGSLYRKNLFSRGKLTSGKFLFKRGSLDRENSFLRGKLTSGKFLFKGEAYIGKISF